MNKGYLRWLLVGLLGLVAAIPVLAQYEYHAWSFGAGAGLLFPAVPGSGAPMLTNSRIQAIEGCASIADSAGRLLLYTSGEEVYDRQNQLLAGGQLTTGPGVAGSNAVQGTLLLKHPGIARHYLLFKIDEAQHQFVDGLRYAEITMTPDGSTGQLLQPLPRRLTPVGYRVTEAMTAVRHANGGDYWVVVHQYLGGEFLSYRIGTTGPDTVPVRSVAGSYHSFANPGVPMRASPDGRQLAACVPGGPVELFDFDNQTGRLRNARTVPGTKTCYGLEFSPDGNLLYLTYGNQLLQADLRTGAAPVVVGSSPPANNNGQSFQLGTVQRGPDSRLYVAEYQARALGVVNAPNVAGVGCNFVASAATLGSQSLYGLPNFANQPPRPLRLLAPVEVCVGQMVTFQADGLPVDNQIPTWNFGDPSAGAANQATGRVVAHIYHRPGTYQVLVSVAMATGTMQRTQLVRVQPLPTLQLLAGRIDTVLCKGEALIIRANSQPRGTTFRWQDGSADSVLVAQQPGRYTLEVRSPAGCLTRDSVLVRDGACAAIPNIITPNGDQQNQTLVLAGLRAADWSVQIFNRWGRQVYYQPQYANAWDAAGQAAGIYYYLLINRFTGARRKGWVEVVK